MIIEPGRVARSMGSVPGAIRASIVLGLGLAVGAAAGCGETDRPPDIAKSAVVFDDVPQSIRDAARKALPPNIKLNEAWKNLDREGKLHSYEVRGHDPATGKTREVRVSLTGEILESE